MEVEKQAGSGLWPLKIWPLFWLCLRLDDCAEAEDVQGAYKAGDMGWMRRSER